MSGTVLRALVVGLTFVAGCATTVPLQTASVVDDGVTRVGAEANAALFCGTPSALLSCALYPEGLALPEVRGSARRGIGDGVDVGAALAARVALYAVDRPVGGLFTFDVKRELWSRPLPWGAWGERLLVSASPLLAVGAAGAVGLAPTVEAEFGVPLHVGLVQPGGEWVTSLRVSQHVLLPHLGADLPTPYRVIATTRLGFAAGSVFRSGLGIQLGYQSIAFGSAALSRADSVAVDVTPAFTSGAWQLSVGWLWDLH